MGLGKFIYIIDPETFKKSINKGILKLIPEQILTNIYSRTRPKVKCKYLDKASEEIIGYGIGILLPEKTYNKEKYLSKIIKAVNSISNEDILTVCIDRIALFQDKDLLKIKEECNVEISNGRQNNIKLAWYVIKKICKYNNIKLKELEVLLIGDDTENTRRLVLEIAKDIKYLTIKSNKSLTIQSLVDEMFCNTGLSIHVIDSTNNKIDKYRIIINLDDDFQVNVGNIKKKTIIFDLGKNKELSKNIRENRKDLLVINDLVLNRPTNIACDIKELQFNNEVLSHVYEILKDTNKEDLQKVIIGNKAYTINDASEIYLKGGETCRYFTINNRNKPS